MTAKTKALIDQLAAGEGLRREGFLALLGDEEPETARYLFARGRKVRQAVYGRDVYMRGLIECGNYCRNDCFYCGIRKSNRAASRYRLTEEEILACCQNGYDLGFRTFVLQGGEDPYFDGDRVCAVIAAIKADHPDCAVTLSLGEKSRDLYRRYRAAGADRYLLRHETANAAHYQMLHPANLSLENRKRCLYDLKELGFQVGCGFMVGSPGQTDACLADDLQFLQDFQPHMVGIGPFIPHSATPFAKAAAGTLKRTLFLLAVARLLLPQVLMPATTALATIDPIGQEQGILAGANVVMPNLSPAAAREKYRLYDRQANGEAAAGLRDLSRRLAGIGYRLSVSRGDHPAEQGEQRNHTDGEEKF